MTSSIGKIVVTIEMDEGTPRPRVSVSAPTVEVSAPTVEVSETGVERVRGIIEDPLNIQHVAGMRSAVKILESGESGGAAIERLNQQIAGMIEVRDMAVSRASWGDIDQRIHDRIMGGLRR